MQLVDKQDYPPVRLLYLVQHGFQTLLEFALILSARDKRAHIQRKQLAVFKVSGNITAHYSQRQTLGDSGLADARLADKAGVVFRLSRKYADNVAYLGVTPDNGVELVLPRQLHQVLTIFFEYVVGFFGILRGDALISAYIL